jgi:hypothetical protein
MSLRITLSSAEFPSLNALKSANHPLFSQVLSNVGALAQLRDILERFEKVKIETLVLKGFSTGIYLYKDPFSRKMNDIDLLVRRCDYKRAISELSVLGYKLESKYTDVSTLTLAAGKSVEVHTHPFSRLFYGDGVEHFFENATTMKIGELSFNALCFEDFFLQLCVHLYQHIYYYAQEVPYQWKKELVMAFSLISEKGDKKHLTHDSYRFLTKRAVKLSLETVGLSINFELPEENEFHSLFLRLLENPRFPKFGGFFGVIALFLFSALPIKRKLTLLKSAFESTY